MLLYDETNLRARLAPPRTYSAPPAKHYVVTVRNVLAVLRKRWLWILTCALIGTLVAFLAGKALTPRYTAESQLYLDPRDLKLVDKELTPTGQDSNGYLTIVESQAQVITSSNVLGRVVEKLDLAHDPEFVNRAAGLDLIAKIKIALGLAELPQSDPRADAASALNALSSRVNVRRTGRTFIVDVEAWSREGDKAARIANAVVDSYLAEESANRADSANRASAGLIARLAELRDEVGSAEGKVQAYKAQNGLVGTRDTLVTDQQLTQLNSQLAAARVRAADAQSRFDQLQRSQKAGLDTGATEDALASQTIAAMRTQFAELSRRQAELSHDLGPRHPLVTSINSQVQQSRRLIDQEIARYVQAAKTDLARAQATVSALEQSFDQAKGKTVGMAEASIRLRELERDAQAARAVYEAFLVRARETGEQARLNLNNARVITPAITPVQRSYPPPAKTLALLGLLAGLALGVGASLGEDRLRRDMLAASAADWQAPPEAIAPSRRRVRASVTYVDVEPAIGSVGGAR